VFKVVLNTIGAGNVVARMVFQGLFFINKNKNDFLLVPQNYFRKVFNCVIITAQVHPLIDNGFCDLFLTTIFEASSQSCKSLGLYLGTLILPV
jgi:hypothetical protein